ncbi:something about silencing, SAS, complex subunit 4-domain-containing protein [Xylariaceae sp. FL0016]|nr:something about silencing, SAS, complex subunit 4-domain-containing protein [Xylariaceae sp. FL0016]
MATSTRRAEGYQRPQHQHSRRASHQTSDAKQSPQMQMIATHAHPQSRMKRPLDPIDHNHDPLKSKRARITVEILSRKSITVKPQLPAVSPPSAIALSSTPAPQQPPPPPPPSNNTETSTTAPDTDYGITKHKETVITGIQHELDRLQPSAADASSAKESGRRKLRSQEATRFKSELSAYFPDYDEVIGNDPKEQHTLNVDTPIVVTDSGYLRSVSNTAPYPELDPGLHPPTVRAYGDRLFTDLHDSQHVHFTFLKARLSSHIFEDPLSDDHYAASHRKAERLEKSIRNTERGRAQHERDQIVRLLNDLQGQDWLRTMGVNGVTESRKKTFEPARDHFIKGCQAILDKFRQWSQEEKKRKLEKERLLAEEAEEVEDENSDQDEDMDDVEVEDSVGDDGVDDRIDESDVDASARQLHDEEALARAKYAASSLGKRSRGEPPPDPPTVDREFTSFFEKRHLRDAALSKGRRRGRTVVAWGHAVPDMAEYDFDLPEDFLDEDTLRARERQKRRERRQHKH